MVIEFYGTHLVTWSIQNYTKTMSHRRSLIGVIGYEQSTDNRFLKEADNNPQAFIPTNIPKL
jgi:hypothetical protein